jgi:hypothetical protein
MNMRTNRHKGFLKMGEPEAHEMTLGENRVRLTFNPNENSLVYEIKQKSAELIDLCETIKAKDPRLAALAQTYYEDAAMWAVKLATS